MDRQLSKNKITEEDYYQTFSNLAFTHEPTDLQNCDYIIEAITENFEIKTKVLKQFELIAPKAILGSNTSSISLTKLASGLKKPSQLIGLHFFNPVPLMKITEIIPALQTSHETITLSQELSNKMGNKSVFVKDGPGFVSNRVLMPMINEAIICLD